MLLTSAECAPEDSSRSTCSQTAAEALPEVRTEEKNALLSFKGADLHDDLSSWSGSCATCDDTCSDCPCAAEAWASFAAGVFDGVQCDRFQGRVSAISLYNKRFSGSVTSLVSLTGLVYLRIEACDNVAGSIDNFNGLTQLSTLILASPLISGVFAGLGTIPGLTELRLAGTSVSGSLANMSAHAGTTSQLETLDLSGTAASGSLRSLANFTQLRKLRVSNTTVDGSLEDLEGLALTELDLRRLSVSGPLKSLASMPLAQLRLSDTLVVGGLSSLARLPLSVLAVESTSVHGSTQQFASSATHVTFDSCSIHTCGDGRWLLPSAPVLAGRDDCACCGDRNELFRATTSASCETCPAGSYTRFSTTNVPRVGTCTLCPEGQSMRIQAANHSRCEECPAGKYGSNEELELVVQGATRCEQCPIGTFKNHSGGSCEACTSVANAETWKCESLGNTTVETCRDGFTRVPADPSLNITSDRCTGRPH